MGLFDLVGSLVEGAINTATLPIKAIKDVVNNDGSLSEGIDKIVKNAEDAADEIIP